MKTPTKTDRGIGGFSGVLFFKYVREGGLQTNLLHTAPYCIAPRICGSVVDYKCENSKHVLIRSI